MKKKNLLLCLCMALVFTASTAVMTSCGDPVDSSSSVQQQEDLGQDGTYYNTADDASELVLSEGDYTLTIGGETKTGKYSYDGSTFVFVDGATITNATYTEGVLVFTYNDVTYKFVEKVDYTITYNVDGETASTQTVRNGKKATAPDAPSKENYAFVGWYKDAAYKTAFNFDTDVVSGDITLYARFVEVNNAQEYPVTYYVDGQVFATKNTVSGGIYEIPTPTKEGATFAGWWTSDYDDVNKLTEQVQEGMQIEEPTAVYAVWVSATPLVSVNAEGISWKMDKSAQVTLKVLKGATEIFTRTLNATSYEYDFGAQESGDYVVEVTVSGVTGKAFYKNKALAKITSFDYEGSVLTWQAVKNATKYLVSVECGDANHTHVDEEVTTNSYDFANCAMKATGIKFTVKAVADGYTTSVSDVYAVVKNLDAVSNLVYNQATAQFTWDAVENATSYMVVVNNKQYTTTTNAFDAKDFATGNLTASVTPVAAGFNSPAATTATASKTTLPAPQNISLTGAVVTWDKVDSATGYVVTVDGKEYNVSTNSFDLLTATNIAANAKSCTVTVKAKGATAAQNSMASEPKTVGFGVMSDSLTYENGKVVWEPVINAKKFEVRLNGGAVTEVAASALSADIVFTKAGNNKVEVRCYNQSNEASDWVSVEVEVYEITFDYGVALVNKPAQYKAAGDTFTIPEANPETPGYEFQGWFNKANNGIEYESEQVVFDPANGTVVYATWKANTYTLKYSYNGLEFNQSVTYGQPYNLPVVQQPYVGDAHFGGWWSELNGQGIQYTDNKGQSIGVWDKTQDAEVFAYEIVPYEFVPVTSVTTGQPGYSVKAGTDIGKISQIKIPAYYEGLPVIGIEQMGFASCGHLTKISIPDTMETIFLGLDGPFYGTGSAFYQCTTIEEFEVYEVEGNHQKFYKAIDGALVRMTDYNGVELVCVPAVWQRDEYRIPDEVTTITTNLFRSSKYLKKIIVPNTVAKIDAGAFYYCKMQELVFEEGGNQPLTIGAGAFKSCEFTSLTLPARMGQFEDALGNVFMYCSYLKEIKVEEGNQYYSAKEGFLYNKEGTTLLYAPRGKSGEVRIPNGTVTIAGESFYYYTSSTSDYCQNITKVIIPIGVEEIGARAFKAIPSLTEVEFLGGANDAKINIGAEAFHSTILSSLTLPANTGNVGAYAFGNIKTLGSVRVEAGEGFSVESGAFGDASNKYYVTNVYLGKDVHVFDVNGAFGPTKLSTIEIHPENTHLKLEEGVLFDYDITQIVYYPASKTGNYTIPSTIKVIGGNVFNGKSLEKVEIPFTVEEIGAAAFANCARLTTVTFLPSTDASAVHPGLVIGVQAFQNGTNLKEIILPNYTKEIGKQAFESCESLTGKFVVPEGVTKIGDAAFRYAAGITSFSLPASLEELATGTDNSTGVVNATYPLYYRTFIGCDSLESITVAAGNEKYVTVDGILYGYGASGKITDLITCPSGYAINGGKAVIPGTVRNIWAYAFYKNVALQEVSFADVVLAEGETATSVNIAIGKAAFEEAKGLKRAVLGTGVTTISNYLFKNCSALEYVFIPNTVSSIEYGQPFTGCYALSNIDFEKGNESNALIIKGSNGPNNAYTGSSAFYKLTALKSIVFPKRTKEIGNMALVDCANLEYVYVPNTVTTMGNWLFGYSSNTKYRTGCPNLKVVEFEEGNDELPLTIGQRTFEGAPITSITLPKRTSKLDQYAFAGSKITSITIPENVASIGAYAFQYCADLKEIVLEGTSKITSIGDYAFASCAIKNFEIPATVQTIGQYAFAYTLDMEEITFAEGSQLKEIKNYAFRQTGISKLELPESTNNITLGTDLFQYCPNLEEIYLSSSVTSIKDTFGHCGSLQRVTVSADNVNFSVEGNALYNQNKTAIQYLFESANVDEEGVYRIADGVTEIGEAAFRGQIDIKKLIIPASVNKIGKSAFRYCVNLEEIEFDLANSQLNEIAESAFEGCSKLKSVNLPVSVKTLGKYAFASCSALADVTMNGVATLGGYTFYQCTSLKEIDLSSVSKAGAYDFSYSGLTKVHVPAMTGDTYMFYYAQDLAEVTFDEGVTALGNYMFRGCKSLTEIKLHEGIAKLGNYAFAQTGITSFEFVNPSVTTGTYLFYGCSKLKTVKLVEGMTILTTGMFYNCTSLGADMPEDVSAVEIPSSITTAHSYVFYGCESMKMIEFPAGIVDFGSSSKWSSSTTTSYIFQNCTNLKKIILPATLERVAQYAFTNCTSLKEVENTGNLKFVGVSAFRNTGLEKITLPSVTELKGYALADNVYLEEILLNDNLAAIDYNAFMNCTSLESITLPSMLTLLGSTNTTGNGNVFQGCTALKSITLPRGISEIRKYTFEGCTSLEEVNFEGQIILISPYAFANCTALTDFAWTDYLATIDDYAFANSGITKVEIAAATNSVSETAFIGCPITEFKVAEDNVYYKVVNNVLCNYDTNEWMLVLPGYTPANGKLVINKDNSMKFVEAATAFAGNETITEIEIAADAGWTEIPVNLFYNMKNLTKVTLPEGIETIGDYAFEACTKLASVNIPSTVTSIGGYAFFGCESLTNITLPNGKLEVIGESAFEGTKLASVEIPASVKTIERYAFYGIEELATIKFNEGLETIGGQAFAGAGITEVTIPASVQKLGSTVSIQDTNSSGNTTTSNQDRSFVFAECKKLEKVTFLGSEVNLTGSTFKNCTALTTVVLPTGLKMIESYMFYGCTSLTDVVIPDTVETIGGYAFAYSGIKSITIPANVVCIGTPTLMTDPYQTGSTTGQTSGAMYEFAYPNGHVFMGCTNLTEVTFKGDLKQIGWYAFEGCTALETIALPNSVEIIGDYAFANCTALKTLNVPKSALFIGNYAFANTAITSVVIPSTTIVYNNVFSGWTAEQTVNVELSAYKAWSIWSLTWNAGTKANVVWDYAPATQD